MVVASCRRLAAPAEKRPALLMTMSTGLRSDSIALFTDSSDNTSTPAMTCPPSASRSAEDDRTRETRSAPV